jgi:hypothetical protein
MNKGPPIQVRDFSFFLVSKQYAPALIFVLCMHNKKGLSLQVKNKPCLGIGIMLLCTLVYMVTNTGANYFLSVDIPHNRCFASRDLKCTVAL